VGFLFLYFFLTGWGRSPGFLKPPTCNPPRHPRIVRNYTQNRIFKCKNWANRGRSGLVCGFCSPLLTVTPLLTCNADSSNVTQIFEIKFCIDNMRFQFRNCTWNVNLPCARNGYYAIPWMTFPMYMEAWAPYLIFSMHYYL
jgi:hypothetical protein